MNRPGRASGLRQEPGQDGRQVQLSQGRHHDQRGDQRRAASQRLPVIQVGGNDPVEEPDNRGTDGIGDERIPSAIVRVS